jgi:hypothetical protein
MLSASEIRFVISEVLGSHVFRAQPSTACTQRSLVGRDRCEQEKILLSMELIGDTGDPRE